MEWRRLQASPLSVNKSQINYEINKINLLKTERYVFCGLFLSWVEKLNLRRYPPGN